jgi:coupling of ubiquitin conjugation to ER degradation protein 1
MPDEEPSLNIPSLLTLAVVSFFVIRWFFKRDGDSDAPRSRGRARGNIVDPAQVEQISQMFPQLSTREIMWDLQRNGGNVAATTERVLSGRGLDAVCSLRRLVGDAAGRVLYFPFLEYNTDL